ncbi:MAG: CHAD domain-containing protein [Burkholderiaceae bacterium]|nr:CHAD domain-containing protein [Burkholderiaceae bacterium]
MVEVELKFQVPAAAAAAVRRAVATASAHRLALAARYFDTPDRQLAAAGFALRLRREDDRWVQTLKGRGDATMQRPEHNVPVEGDAEPALDLARHDGTPVADALRAAGVDPQAIGPLFGTDVQRTQRRLRSGATVVELAFDEGFIVAGDARAAVCELELELVAGTPQALIGVAARWAERHGLWLDVRTKAERGDLLVRGVAASPPVHAQPPLLSAHDRPADALRAMVRACLDQVLPNASAVAAGGFEPEHVHQLRVGLRRLRTALRVFGDASPDVDATWEPRLAAAFGRLGAARDLDALSATLVPALRAAGAPLVDLGTAAAAEDPGAVVREPGWTALMLALLGFVQSGEGGDGSSSWALPAAHDGELLRWARRKLRRAHRQAVTGGETFAQLPEEAQHRIRKRVKRLRYSVEFVSSLYPPKAVQRFLKRLRPAQEVLGEYNDLLVAEAAYRARVADDPRAWFAVGWLVGRRPRQLERCARELAKLADAETFWRRR